ncbi:MAG: hypothetical protein LBC68_01440 [Prevotellaceae bacterium]|jgi:hypothetical protein|nr:hypothetical protein [Prevotellaceae bacterium]
MDKNLTCYKLNPVTGEYEAVTDEEELKAIEEDMIRDNPVHNCVFDPVLREFVKKQKTD